MVRSKPKGRTSAYAYFVRSVRNEEKRKNSAKFVLSKFGKKCAAIWRKMDEKKKKHFIALAEKDKKRYAREVAKHPKSKRGKRRKRRKDRSSVKHPLSAYLYFCNDERPKVTRRMANPNHAKVAKELSRRWKRCTKQQKIKYERLAAKDRIRYKKAKKGRRGRRGHSNKRRRRRRRR